MVQGCTITISFNMHNNMDPLSPKRSFKKLPYQDEFDPAESRMPDVVKK